MEFHGIQSGVAAAFEDLALEKRQLQRWARGWGGIDAGKIGYHVSRRA